MTSVDHSIFTLFSAPAVNTTVALHRCRSLPGLEFAGTCPWIHSKYLCRFRLVANRRCGWILPHLFDQLVVILPCFVNLAKLTKRHRQIPPASTTAFWRLSLAA